MQQLRRNQSWISAAACAFRPAGVPGSGYRAAVPRHRRGVCLFAVGAALLAAFGVPGLSRLPALASSSRALTWTKQAPAASPPARWGASMAYDAATGKVVLFGGVADRGFHVFNDTWLWDGTTWAKQAPKTSPPGREEASMAYDAATGTVVLFGGRENGLAVNDTWVWNGT